MLIDIPRNSLDAFVQMRSGLLPSTPPGQYSDVVFWSADGELYQSPSGKMLARMEGLECSHAVRLSPEEDEEEEEDIVRIFSRKLFWFLHPETDEIMTEWNGLPVDSIQYDAQVFDMKKQPQPPPPSPTPQEEGTPTVLQQSEKDDFFLTPIQPTVVRSTRLVPCMPIIPRWGGSPNLLMFQVPVFIDIKIPIVSNNDTRKENEPKSQRYQAWEFYDYYMDLQHHDQQQQLSSSDTFVLPPRPPVVTWMRQGSTPPFCLDGNGVMHARGHRVDSFEELPLTTQDYVNKYHPLFRGPPQDIEEVDELLGNGGDTVK